ncbi:hypothetical protein N3K63_05985 [Microbacterium sp. W1N]|uniref:DUF6414 family protein n=1 Tax=Microbacterium festucae TaxID=2977531 RepID=UPI0021C13CB0|nr:hypothetical protein [Microbacterium festucae]MCT9819836.1 hypothetical protein [Microbacterium festucae]
MRRRNALGEIREFIYLDETGVESMLAAVDGEILVQTTNSTSRSREFTAGATMPGDSAFGATEVSTGLKLGRTRAQEETRKSVAQSAFARFRSKNHQSFVLRHAPTYRWLAKRRLDALDQSALRKYGAGVKVSDLRRGDLIELEVTLAAADSYQVRTAINAVADVVNSFPELLPLEQREVFRQVRPLTALIDNLNGEAVPVVAMLPNLRLVTIGGEDWLTVTPGESSDVVELHAVTMPNWFWGDLGRTLFQSRRYTVLCRIIDPELRPESASSYVGAILNVVHPQLAATVDNIGPMMMGALRQGTERGATGRPSEWLSAYADGVAELTGSEAVRPDLSEMPTIDVRQMPMAKQLDLFGAVDQHYGIEGGAMAQELSTLRNDVRDRFGLWPWSESTPAAAPKKLGAAVSRLDVELIAAYW